MGIIFMGLFRQRSFLLESVSERRPQLIKHLPEHRIQEWDMLSGEASQALNQHLCHQGQSSAVTVRGGNHDT
jgi:hypothetical protein